MQNSETEIEELLRKLKNNSINREELHRLYFLLEKNGQMHKVEELFEEIWKQDKLEHPGTDIQRYRILKKVEKQVGIRPVSFLTKEQKARQSLGVRSFKIAATIAILIVTGYFLVKHSINIDGNEEISKEWMVYTSTDSTKKRITLADNTAIWLSAKSSLSVAPDYGKGFRKVKLTGDAFFEVTPNKEAPFIVTTDSVETTVLGTSFYIESSRKKTDIKVSVATGKVKVSKIKSGEVFLIPGQQALVVRGQENIQKNTVPDYYFMGIKDLNFHFDDIELGEIVKILSRAYSVEIVFANQNMKTWHYTATFEKLPLEQALLSLGESKSFHFKIIENGSVLIE